MSTLSSASAKRPLSLDILAASGTNDNKIKVWSTHNNNKADGTLDNPNFNNVTSGHQPRKSPPLVREKANPNGLAQEEGSKDGPLKTPTSEVQQTWLHKYLSWRFFMVLLLQSSLVVGMFHRHCLPMAMVCMVKMRSSGSSSLAYASNRTDNKTENTSAGFRGHESVSGNASYYRNNSLEKDPDYEFDWSSEVQGLILTSTMFSAFIGPLLSNIAKDYIGSKRTMSLINFTSTLLTFLSPVAARTSPYCLVAIRILLGISLGGNTLVISDCVAWWAPHDEKLTMISLTYTGINIGNVLSSFLTGYLCLVPVDNGWPFIFYTFGTVSFLWGISWHFLGSHKPDEHPYISEKEKQYIISHRIGMDTPAGKKKVKPPYRKLLTSVPVLAYLAVGTCHMWSTQVLATYLPSFFSKRMKFSIQDTGLLASLTSSFRMFGAFFWTALGNKLMSTVGTSRSRKICICLALVLAGISTIMIGFFDESYKWVVLGLLIFVMINQSVRLSTVAALPLDMAPRDRGIDGDIASSGLSTA